MNATTQTELRASVKSILFGPAEDGYVMLSLEGDRGERIVADGRVMPASVAVGDDLWLAGKWVEGKRGLVFRARDARKELPRTTEGIRKWLARAKVPGIGEVKAGKLVDAFGLETIEALCEEREGVAAIVGRTVIAKAAESIRERRDEAAIGATLTEHGVGVRTQKKILERYGDRTGHILTAEPYRLIIEIAGVAFGTADKIARAAGMAIDAPARIQAGIIDQLRQAAKEGHCAVYHQYLLERCRQNLYVSERQVEEQIDALKGSYVVETEVRGMRAWASARLNRAEREFARMLARKINDTTVRDFGQPATERAVDQAQAQLGLTLAPEQRDAAIMALRARCCIITGGPGTGKTLVLRVICAAWNVLRPLMSGHKGQDEFALAAPTGKASKRITESTGFEGRTLHRLLEYKPDRDDYDRDAKNPLTEGMICIDEASMPDIIMATKVGAAWGQARIVFIGDTDQLPSVGPGKVLADMLASERVPSVRLTRVYRQAAGSDISIGAERICRGEMPVFGEPGKSDLVHVEISDNEQVAKRIAKMYVETLPAYAEKHGLDPASMQILAPGTKNEVGTIALNQAIQQAIHGNGRNSPTVTLADKNVAGVGDKVIQLENDYDRDVYNGDTGVVVEIDRVGNASVVHVDFGGRIIAFNGSTFSNLALAYALTIHKSQGSEYQIVIIPVTTSHYMMLRRTLLYTGITRAKRLCVVVGTRRAIKKAVDTEDANSRITTLAQAIREECDAMKSPKE